MSNPVSDDDRSRLFAERGWRELHEWSMDELARATPRNEDGSWPRESLEWVGPFAKDEVYRRLQSGALSSTDRNGEVIEAIDSINAEVRSVAEAVAELTDQIRQNGEARPQYWPLWFRVGNSSWEPVLQWHDEVRTDGEPVFCPVGPITVCGPGDSYQLSERLPA